jgi:hypothetical protein
MAVLGDGGQSGAGSSSAELLGLPVTLLAERLTAHLVREIVVRGARGGPLAPRAAQLNHDMTQLQGRGLEGVVSQLAAVVPDGLASLNDAQKAALAQLPPVAAGRRVRDGELAGPAVAGYAGADRRQAVRLLSEALRVAQSISDGWWKAMALAEIAEVSAASDPVSPGEGNASSSCSGWMTAAAGPCGGWHLPVWASARVQGPVLKYRPARSRSD